MKSPFFVSIFSPDNLAFSNLIKNNINVQLQDVTQKKQLKSIVKILDALGTKTMVCENEYVDNGYLDDYLNYYVGCHENYPKICSRIHFFSESFDYNTFEDVISSKDDGTKGKLGEYLGFMVIKPIPMTFVGRTCLKAPVYKMDGKTSLITRKYNSDLFGLKFEVSSLAFQEQDQVVSACTSASIWCLLHALQRHKIKSPAQITLAATEHSKIINTFPNSGLNPVEIERALEYFDLRQYTISPKDETPEDFIQLTQLIKTYIDSNIPMILGAECLEYKDKLGHYEEIGKHAVTIIGYGLGDDQKLDRLIVHDDRQGPFTVLKFVANYDVGGSKKKATVLVNEEQSRITERVCGYKEVLAYTSLIIATDPRVRTGFNTISKTETKLKTLVQAYIDDIEKQVRSEGQSEASPVTVTTCSKLLKNTVYKGNVKSSDYVNKNDILTRNFPKYIWVIDLFVNDNKVFDFVFDSSSLPQGEAYICSCYKTEDAKLLLDTIANECYDTELKDRGEYRFRDSDFILQILKSIKTNTNSFFNYHSEKFGRARMPKLIKPTEIQNEQLNDPNSRLVLYASSDNEGEYGDNRIKTLFEEQEWDHLDPSKGFPSELAKTQKVRKLIWVISSYGALLIGADSQETGHPTLTGAMPARIGGELIEVQGKLGEVYVNNFSGRYSTNYDDTNKVEYLKNAKIKLEDILSRHGYTFEFDSRVNSK